MTQIENGIIIAIISALLAILLAFTHAYSVIQSYHSTGDNRKSDE